MPEERYAPDNRGYHPAVNTVGPDGRPRPRVLPNERGPVVRGQRQIDVSVPLPPEYVAMLDDIVREY
jgi:hypothetical protein